MSNANFRRNIGGGNITAKCIAGTHNRLAYPFAMACKGSQHNSRYTRALDSGGLAAPPPPGSRR